MRDDDVAHWVEAVLISMMDLKDGDGLGVRLSKSEKMELLAYIMAAVANSESDILSIESRAKASAQNSYLDAGSYLINSAQLAKILNYTTVHIRRLVKAGKLPAPIIIGDRKMAWRASDIKSFLNTRFGAAPPPQISPLVQ